jgi:threonine/homoserine/homoserine lactone efflux protein
MMALWLQGLVIGLAIAAPVGVIGTLVIRRSLAGGVPLGFATGMGAAVADGVYGVVAVLGFAALAPWLALIDTPLRVVGALVLGWIAWGIWRAPVGTPAEVGPTVADLGRAFASTFVLTLINPATILLFAGIFASLSLADQGTAALAVAAGVFCGSALWWLGLASVVGSARRFVSPRAMGWINLASALTIAGFAVAGLAGIWLS